MKYELDGTGLFADGRTILFPGGNRDVKAIAELVRRANAYDGLLDACMVMVDGIDRDLRLSEDPLHPMCRLTLGNRSASLRAAIAAAEGGA